VEYVDSKEEPLMQSVKTHQRITNSTMLPTARRLKRELQRETRQIKDSITQTTKERWQERRIPGQLQRNLDEKLVDIEQSYRWLKLGDIQGETESTVMAAQDQKLVQNIFKMKF
jgi:IS30 family transposase